MFKKLNPMTVLKTFAQVEKEEGITENVCDISTKYLGLPPSKKFYKNEEIDFKKTRNEFDKVAKRLGLNVE
jgi:hypothetical protein